MIIMMFIKENVFGSEVDESKVSHQLLLSRPYPRSQMVMFQQNEKQNFAYTFVTLV